MQASHTKAGYTRIAAAAAVCFALIPGIVQAAGEGNAASSQLSRLFSMEREGLNAVTAQHVARLVNPASDATSLPEAPRYDATWLAGLSVEAPDQQTGCLQVALYHEARGESIRGQFAVAEVILNRRDSPSYPDSICGVVNQGASAGRNGRCQFSFACDGNSQAMHERTAADLALRIASVMTSGAPRTLTDGATHFHTRHVKPRWSRIYTRTAHIGAHLFYRQPTQLSSR